MSEEQDLLRKIGLLLKKAEGTDNEHEADAFYTKAHELMVRHAIDEARIRAEQKRIDGNKMEQPVVEDYMFSSYAHHARAKEDLLNMVAGNHSVRSLPYSNRKRSNNERVAAAGATGLFESQWTRLVGYKDDIELVKLLYLSLIVQSQRFAQDDWRRRYGNDKFSSYEDGRLGKFSWMSAHMEGFAERIGSRFKELTQSIFRDVKDGNALILDKDANVMEWMYEHGLAQRPKSYCYEIGWPDGYKVKSNSKPWYCFRTKGHDAPDAQPYPTPHYFQKPVYGSSGTGVGRRTSYEGRNAGRSAADRADIGATRVRSGSTAIGDGR